MRPKQTLISVLVGLSLCSALTADTVVVFNEIQYHPEGLNDPTLEFVELFNQNAVDIDLSGWRISGEVDFAFPVGTTIGGGSYLVVASDPAALEAASGITGVLGPFANMLGNGGGSIRLRNNNSRLLDEVIYNDRAPWPIGADGSGASLSKLNPNTPGGFAWNWTHSLKVGGTPGAVNFTESGPPPSSGGNIALGKKIIAGSSAYDNQAFNQGSFPASNVVDGSTTDIHSQNYWLGTGGDPTQFFVLDLGAEYDLTEIHLRNTHNQQWNDRGTINFTITASNSVNGSNLLVSPQTILTGTLSDVSDQDPIIADEFDSSNGLAETTARYLRFDSLTAKNNNAGLNEIEVYATSSPPPVNPEAIPLTINEVAGTTNASFWVELYNAGNAAIELEGFILSFEDAGEYQFHSGVSIPANDHLLIPASTLALATAPTDGENLYLYQPGKIALLDTLRLDDLPLARFPDGGDEIFTIGLPAQQTPGTANGQISVSDAIVINEIMYHHRPNYASSGDAPSITLLPGFGWNAAWRFNQSGDDLGTNWNDTSHSVGGNWESGNGPLGYETSTSNPPEPIVTQLNRTQDNDPRVITFYFETDFTVSAADLADITGLNFNHQTDDGAVFYLNGQEIHRYDMPTTAVTASTLAVNNNSTEADSIESFSVDATHLVAGTNRISVEVHQSSVGSSDVVMGLKMDLEKSTPGINPPTEFSENKEEWIELHNRSNNLVHLDGWDFDGAVDFTFPEGSQIPANGYLVITEDLADFQEKFPDVTAIGNYSGGLGNGGDRLYLRDSLNNTVDKVYYLDDAPWPDAADGGGSSMELRHPDLENNASSSWASSTNESSSQWKNYTYTLTAHTPTYRPSQNGFHELRLGLLDGGEMLLDDFSVIEDPSGAALELIANGSFSDATGWRLLGTHQDSKVVSDNGQNVLHVKASSRFNYLNNLIETNLTNGGSLREVTPGTTYQISFRAKWLSGSPQFRFEFYYNKLAELVILDQPTTHGTPGAQNSTYSSSIGPTLTKLLHQPAVPTSSQAINISVQADDPDGLNTLSLKYSVNAGAFQTASMSSSDGSNFTATLPAQSNNALVQFYVEALDQSGNLSFAPPRGPDSHALIKVTSPNTGGAKQSIRVNMLTAEANAMHVERDILDNQRRGCTIIINEDDIAYDSGIRLRGSMWSRRSSGRVGFNLKLPADKLYRGTHSTITLRNGNRREITVKHLVNSAGGLHDNYNDIVQFNGHLSSYNSRSRLEMTRFGNDYLKSLPGGKGDDGTVFKMEGIRVFQQTQDGTKNTPKLPFPIGWISNFDLADQGDDKEDYRHNIRINTSLERDDYTDTIEMLRLFNLSGTALENAAPDIIDIDVWCRQFALLSLCGIGDTYSQGNPHNLNFYARPDGLVDVMPWDWDFTFNRSTTSSLWGNKNVAKLFARPKFTRLYHGHLHDLMQRVFNTSYANTWFTHLGSCAGESYSSNVSYVTNRANHVLGQLPTQIPFSITTNGGSDFDHDSALVTLAGQGWINVREITVNGTPQSLPVSWSNDENWEINVPLEDGANTLNLTALDFEGNSVGTDSIVVTNTSSVIPAAAGNLVISEIHYNPAADDNEEFLEFLNIHPTATIDLTGVLITDGIDFEFLSGTQLAPGERLLVVRNRSIFEAIYGTNFTIAGAFDNLTKLSNDGETIRVEAPGGVLITTFTYNDGSDWPQSPDGDGKSLILVNPATLPDLNLPLSWRPSTTAGGNPGSTDATIFTGGDLAAYALSGAQPTASIGLDDFVYFTYERALGVDDVTYSIQTSSNLNDWVDNSGQLLQTSVTDLNNGYEAVSFRSANPKSTADKLFIRLKLLLP